MYYLFYIHIYSILYMHTKMKWMRTGGTSILGIPGIWMYMGIQATNDLKLWHLPWRLGSLQRAA